MTDEYGLGVDETHQILLHVLKGLRNARQILRGYAAVQGIVIHYLVRRFNEFIVNYNTINIDHGDLCEFKTGRCNDHLAIDPVNPISPVYRYLLCRFCTYEIDVRPVVILLQTYPIVILIGRTTEGTGSLLATRPNLTLRVPLKAQLAAVIYAILTEYTVVACIGLIHVKASQASRTSRLDRRTLAHIGDRITTLTFDILEVDDEGFTIGRERGGSYEITGMFLVVHLIFQFHVGAIATAAAAVAVFDFTLYAVRYEFLGVNVQLTSIVVLRLMQIKYVSFDSEIEVPGERIARLYQVISVMRVDT